ncbi:transmembrane channel-like protein 6 isoform X3 [Columba livia]|uniref:transmembrane channel-like protein 6 isoform X3 n=1 Tax=Columba livia TaxID=8932 RepID=UPI0031BA5B46
MSRPPSFTLRVPEDTESDGQEPSPDNEGALHSSFHQLIQEQSSLVEAGVELEMQARGREHPAHLPHPGAGAAAWQEPGQGEQHPGYSSTTLRILASMPSRTIGRSRGAIISQYYNRTARLRRRSSRPPLQQLCRAARPSVRQYDLETDPARATLEGKRNLLVKELLSLSPSQRSHMLLTVPLSLAEKRTLRRELSGQMRPPRQHTEHRALSSPCGWSRGCVILGSFTHSLLYYGYYSNTTLNEPCASSPNSSTCPLAPPPLPYNMPLAYVFSVGVSFLVTCVLLVYSVSRSFGESYRVGSSAGDLAVKVFCAWDFKVVQRRSVKLQCENICTQLKELLAEQRSRSRSRSLCQRLGHCAVLLLAWAVSLGTVLGGVLAVHHVSQHMHTVQQELRAQGSGRQQREAVLLVLPLTVSLLNTLLPHLYTLLARWERQDSPAAQVYVAICRNLILKMVVLGLLCYQWLSRRVVCSMEECWETCVGQDLYRFMVIDFMFTLLDTLFRELLWRLILEKRLKRKQKPEFDIARNVLELIYGQTLTWLGVLFAPLLPAVQTLKLLLLFYIKKSSLMRNCRAPSTPWQASRMSTIFITLLCFPSFLGAAVFLSYTIWAVRPSETCGPFRGLETIYKSGQTWVQVLEKSSPNITWLAWVHQHLVENSFLLFFMSGVLLAVIYFNIQVVRGQRRIIRLLEEQIANEGQDKIFLIQKLHSVYERRERCA